MADHWKPLDPSLTLKSLRRIFLIGAPYNGKTTGLLTLPPVRHIMVVPKEKGAASIPADDPDTKAYIFDEKAPAETRLTAFQQLGEEILTGKHGPVGSLCIDGGHILADLVMEVLGWTSTTLDDKEGPRQYPKYYHEIKKLIDRWAGSDVPVFAMTCYDGREQTEDSTGSRIKGQTQIWPQMPGQLAKTIMGSFGCAFHCERMAGNPTDIFSWRLKPIGQMQACGMHLSPKLLARFPATIPVSVDIATGAVTGGWQTIERILADLTQAAKPAEGGTT